MRLIDADKLIEELTAYRNHTYQTSVYWAIDDAIDRVKGQPTAYDVCEVVEELWECYGDNRIAGAIDIVKRGGVDEESSVY